MIGLPQKRWRGPPEMGWGKRLWVTSAGFLEPFRLGRKFWFSPVSPAQGLLCPQAGVGRGARGEPPRMTGEGRASSSVWGRGLLLVSWPHWGVRPLLCSVNTSLP